MEGRLLVRLRAGRVGLTEDTTTPYEWNFDWKMHARLDIGDVEDEASAFEEFISAYASVKEVATSDRVMDAGMLASWKLPEESSDDSDGSPFLVGAEAKVRDKKKDVMTFDCDASIDLDATFDKDTG